MGMPQHHQTTGRSLRLATLATPRLFITGTALSLAITLAALRGAMIWAPMAESPWYRDIGLILLASRQDWFAVLALALPALLFLRRWRGAFGFLAVALVLLLWAIGNGVAVRMLGEPVTLSWLLYSDFLNSSSIWVSILHFITPTATLRVAAILAAFLAGAVALAAGLARLPPKTPQRRLTLLVPFLVLLSSFAPDLGGVELAAGKRANPAVALAASLFGADRFTGDFGTGGEALSAIARPALMPATPPTRPEVAPGTIRNVIFFGLESTSFKYVQGFDGSYPITPNLLRYQQEGMKFTSAYAHAPASNYFLVSLLDGVVPELSPHSMTYNYPELRMVSLADILGAAGYRRGFFNSADNRFQNTGSFVSLSGFETVLDHRDWLCENGLYEVSDENFQFLDTSNDLCTIPPIIDWIEQDPERPFFVTVRTGMTHYPYFTGSDPQTYTEDENLNRYLNAVRVADQALGLLLDYLSDRGLLDETLVVVMGDHGEAFGEHGNYVHAAALYEENMHIPLVFINPALFSGQSSDIVAGLSDVAPTVLDLLGLKSPVTWQGQSLFAPGRADATLFFAPWNGFQIGYREGSRKYLFNGNSEKFEIYDLASDPFELDDLAPGNPEAVEAAKRTLGAWVAFQNNWIDALLRESGEAMLAQTAVSGPGEVVIHASGTSYRSAPRGEVYLDDTLIGWFDVTKAPVNSEKAASLFEIEQAVTAFGFPVTELSCARRLEVYFMNDEWEGEGQTGDTDLYISFIDVGDRRYWPQEYQTLTTNAGGVRGDYFTLWRKGGLRVDLDVAPECLTQSLNAGG